MTNKRIIMEVLIIAKKIAVVAANGRAAGKVIAEAVSRGFDVTGFGRKENTRRHSIM
jgi:putative NADH-flavin reductase